MSKLAVLMITAFVDMVGLLMVIPLLPFFAEDLGGGGLWVGILVSAFSFAQLVSAPLWGRVSDRYGRRPALLVGLGAAAISYVVFAYASSLWLLLLSLRHGYSLPAFARRLATSTSVFMLSTACSGTGGVPSSTLPFPVRASAPAIAR